MATIVEELKHSTPDSSAAEKSGLASPGHVAEPIPGVPDPRLLADVILGDAPPLVPLTVDQYQAMIRAGILPEKAPIELIDGLLLWKDRRDAGGDLMTEGDRHYVVRHLLRDVLDPLVRPLGCHVAIEPPVLLPNSGVPEPDLAVLRGRVLDYLGRLPEARDAAVLIEVSWSSLRQDRRLKLERYAGAGVTAYWIVNLAASVVEVYGRPDARRSRYEQLQTYGREAAIPLSLFDAGTVEVPIADFLPE